MTNEILNENLLEKFISEQLDCDQMLFFKLYKTFSDNLEELANQGTPKDSADLKKIGRLAHKALPGADSFGATAMSKSLRELEKFAIAGDLKIVKNIYLEVLELRIHTFKKIESVALSIFEQRGKIA